MGLIYVDNSATTAVDPEVIDAMQPFLTAEYFNPSSMYAPAAKAERALDESRHAVARLLGNVRPDEILFTSCATESNNTALFGTAAAGRSRRHIITTRVEHPAVLSVCQELDRRGFTVTYLPVDRSGRLAVEDLIDALRPGETLLVSLMHANNETGVVFPVGDLARVVKETDPDIVVHTDATQTVTKLPVDLRRDMKHVDLLSLSGHKIHAPKGVGALFIRRGTPCRPLLYGGHQEGGRRGGTENVAFIVGLTKAFELGEAHRETESRRLEAMRDRLESGLRESVPHLEINGSDAPRLPTLLNAACHFIEGEGILYQLNEHGICASSGSACTSGSLDPSHVLRAMGVPFTAVHGSIRFSLSRYNKDEDIDTILEVFPEIAERLRRLSPYWDSRRDRPTPEGLSMLEETPQ